MGWGREAANEEHKGNGIKPRLGCSVMSDSFCDTIGVSRPEYWSGLPFPSPDLPDPGIKPRSPALQADSLSSEPQGKPQVRHYGLSKMIPTPHIQNNEHHSLESDYYMSKKQTSIMLRF